MKKSIKPLLFSFLLLCFMSLAQVGMSQGPPPPPPPAEHGGIDNNVPGGNAPIDGGLAITLAMVAAFGAWKVRKVMQKKSDIV